ncbi:DNA damage-inducible protein 1 [Lithohypha guttulata]|nr:DNA damage-inducible protein 1 [Lithohypha guttulata]
MRISVSVAQSDVQISQDFITLEVIEDMSLDTVKGFIEDEIRIPPQAQHFIHNGQPVLNTSQALTAIGITEGDVLSLIIRTVAPQPQDRSQNNQRAGGQRRPAQANAMPDSETLRLQILNDQGLLAQVRERDSELASAVNDSGRFREVFQRRQEAQADQQRDKEEMMALLDADPFNADAQTKIEEIIRQERVMENMRKALEENPESFGRVVMLYIDVTVNNTPIKAFVDSGAQTTIMSPEAAEKCGIMRLIDRRYGGIARGVGTAKILGRVHSADIQIGQYNLASSFTVMEGKGVDLLLGLDMLKRHQMLIDLKDNVLRIQSDAIPFLSENETPKGLDEAMDEEPTVKGPGNTEIGAKTGTVKPAGESSSAPAAQPSASGPSGIRIHPQGSAGNVFSNPQRPQSQPRAQPQTQTQQALRPNTNALPAGVTEQSIAQITDLGFPRQEAVMALQQAGGNVELAISLLL